MFAPHSVRDRKTCLLRSRLSFFTFVKLEDIFGNWTDGGDTRSQILSAVPALPQGRLPRNRDVTVMGDSITL